MDFKAATIEELKKFVEEKQEELRSLRFSASGSKNRNVKLVHEIKKDVARAETEITAKAHNA